MQKEEESTATTAKTRLVERFQSELEKDLAESTKDEDSRVFSPASSHRYMKVLETVAVHIFLVEIFTLIIFCLLSISVIMTSRAEITKSLKMHFFDQKYIISRFEDDQSVRHHLNGAFII